MSPATDRDRIPTTAAALLEDSSLGLSVVVSAPGLEAPLTGHHTTDLIHPSRYLFAGELLLTNGLWVPHRPAEDWIADAQSAGAPVIAFGLNELYPKIPPTVVDACAAHGVALISVHADVSFSRIAEAIDSVRFPVNSTRTGLDHLRRLGQELAGCADQADFLQLIHRRTELRCWLVGAGGRCLAGTGTPPPPRVLRTAVRLGRGGHLSGALDGGRCFFTVGWGLQSSLALVVASAQKDIADEARLVIESIMPYFLIADAERRAQVDIHSAFVRELLDLIWTGSIAGETFAAQMRTLGLDPDAPTMVIASANHLDDIADAVDGCRARGTFTSHDRDINLMVIQSDSEQVTDEIVEIIRESGREPILGTGSPGTGAEGLRRSLAQAIPACRFALTRRKGDRIVRQFDAGSYAGLLHFVDVRMRSAFREALLGPIIAWDEEHHADLLDTLRSFLRNDGKWRQAARELHIHHNTLKYRIDRISSLTGRDLAHPDSRIDLALALAIPETQNP